MMAIDTLSPHETIALKEQLKRGYYLNVLVEGYMTDEAWTHEKVARDVWQNFFDANKQTADGIRIDTAEEDDGRTTVTIRSDAAYPYNRLISFGSGYKEDRRRAAGGKHEGTKMIALFLIREYGCKSVTFGSQDWEMEFYADDPPEGLLDEHNEEQRGLYARLKENPHAEGNYIRITTEDRTMVEALQRARDLFYHSENKDFQHPDIDTKDAGFKMHEGRSGNFYLNGQRIHFDRKGAWETLPHFTFWSKVTPEARGHKIVLNRDRDLITQHDVVNAYIPMLVESMSREECAMSLLVLEPFYEDRADDRGADIGIVLAKTLVQRLAAEGFTTKFADKYLACDVSDETKRTLKTLGYTLCHADMAHVGMERASHAFKEIDAVHRVEPTPEEGKRLTLLRDTITTFLTTTEGPAQHAAQRLALSLGSRDAARRLRQEDITRVTPKEIRLFGGAHPYLEGQYNESFVWLAQTLVHDAHADRAVTTYLHEICHTFGSDQSAEFSYALTALFERWTRYLREHPTALADLDRAWQAIRIPETTRAWSSPAALETALVSLTAARHETAPPSWSQYIDRVARDIRWIIRDDIQEQPWGSALEKFYHDINVHPDVVHFQHIEKIQRESDALVHEKNKRRFMELRERHDRLFGRIIILERRLREEEKAITAHKARKREKQAQKTSIPRLREELRDVQEQMDALMPEYTQLKETIPDDKEFDLQFSRIMHGKLYGRPLNLFNLSEPYMFFPACLQALHEAGEHSSEETVRNVIAFMRKNAEPKYFHDALMDELERLLPIVRREPTQENLRYAQMLYEAITQT